MEKGNAEESAGQAAETRGTATGTAPPSVATQTAGGGGGGSQADQSGPSQEATQERRPVLYQGYTEVPHPDGSVLRLDGNGGATFTDGSVALRLEGDSWVDAKTGQQSHRGHSAKADHRLRSLEMDRGLRKTMMP